MQPSNTRVMLNLFQHLLILKFLLLVNLMAKPTIIQMLKQVQHDAGAVCDLPRF